MTVATEASVQKEIWRGLTQSRLFRLNSGRAWISGLGPRGVQRLTNGAVQVQGARPIALGLAYTSGEPVVGQTDLLGFTPVVITQDMVGHTVAVITAIDAKASKGGRTSPEQQQFVDNLKKSGGIAGIANSLEAARAILDNWYAKFRQKKLM